MSGDDTISRISSQMTACQTGSSNKLLTSLNYASVDNAFTEEVLDKLAGFALYHCPRGVSFYKTRNRDPENLMEQISDQVYDYWVQKMGLSDIEKEKAGTEWWFQVSDLSKYEEGAKAFHWDRDEQEVITNEAKSGQSERSTNETTCSRTDCSKAGSSAPQTDCAKTECSKTEKSVAESTTPTAKTRCPFLGTVTYLTGCPVNSLAPTVVIAQEPLDHKQEEKAEPSKAEEEKPKSSKLSRYYPSNVYLSFPRKAKHMAFSGNFLHGVQSDFRMPILKKDNPYSSKKEENKPTKKRKIEDEKNASDDEPALEKPKHRITFLVNLWLDGAPRGVPDKFDVSKLTNAARGDVIPAAMASTLRMTEKGVSMKQESCMDENSLSTLLMTEEVTEDTPEGYDFEHVYPAKKDDDPAHYLFIPKPKMNSMRKCLKSDAGMKSDLRLQIESGDDIPMERKCFLGRGEYDGESDDEEEEESSDEEGGCNGSETGSGSEGCDGEQDSDHVPYCEEASCPHKSS